MNVTNNYIRTFSKIAEDIQNITLMAEEDTIPIPVSERALKMVGSFFPYTSDHFMKIVSRPCERFRLFLEHFQGGCRRCTEIAVMAHSLNRNVKGILAEKHLSPKAFLIVFLNWLECELLGFQQITCSPP